MKRLVLTVLLLASGALVFAQVAPMSGGQMPDPKQMSGMPLPVPDVQPGTVTVRVIRGQLTNPLQGQTVELTGDGAPRTAKTDEAGRATFSGLSIGSRVKASVTVAGEKVDSQEFDVPATGGIRLMLVATDPEAGKKAEEDRKLAQSPPIRGTVILGSESRFVIEIGDDGLNVFNILQIVNTARRPVQTQGPLVFELPKTAIGASVLEGSSPNAIVASGRVTVSGPFPPGNTTVQFAYSLPLDNDTITIEEKLPAEMTQFTLLAQKVGAMQVSSPQMTQHRDMSSEGQTYVVGQGPAVKAGDTVTLTLTGLPHPPTWPRNISLTLAAAILAAGVWASTRRRRSPDEAARLKKLQEKRDRLFNELTALEQRRRRGEIDESQYSGERSTLVSALERIYAQLEQGAAA